MSAEQQYDGDSDNLQSLHSFIENAKAMSRMNGACILEFFTCPNPACQFQQIVSHQFKESVCCVKCGQRMASIVPRLELPGEVTKAMLQEAIRLVRNSVPEVNKATRDWLERQEGAVKAVAVALACYEVRRALDKVEEVARAMSGGHSVRR